MAVETVAEATVAADTAVVARVEVEGATKAQAMVVEGREVVGEEVVVVDAAGSKEAAEPLSASGEHRH